MTDWFQSDTPPEPGFYWALDPNKHLLCGEVTICETYKNAYTGNIWVRWLGSDQDDYYCSGLWWKSVGKSDPPVLEESK